MTTIHLRQPYKILPHKHQRYSDHYSIPSVDCLVVPIKEYGDDFSCDVRWEDENGELKVKEGVIFNKENLIPIHPMIDPSRQEIWAHYYPLN